MVIYQFEIYHCQTLVMWKKSIALCVLLAIANTEAFVRRDVSSNSQPNVLASIQKNMDQFKRCLDQSFASAANDVNENQLKPVFNVLGDSLLRFSKAFEDLTATTKRPDPDLLI